MLLLFKSFKVLIVVLNFFVFIKWFIYKKVLLCIDKFSLFFNWDFLVCIVKLNWDKLMLGL